MFVISRKTPQDFKIILSLTDYEKVMLLKFTGATRIYPYKCSVSGVNLRRLCQKTGTKSKHRLKIQEMPHQKGNIVSGWRRKHYGETNERTEHTEIWRTGDFVVHEGRYGRISNVKDKDGFIIVDYLGWNNNVYHRTKLRPTWLHQLRRSDDPTDVGRPFEGFFHGPQSDNDPRPPSQNQVWTTKLEAFYMARPPTQSEEKCPMEAKAMALGTRVRTTARTPVCEDQDFGHLAIYAKGLEGEIIGIQGNTIQVWFYEQPGQTHTGEKITPGSRYIKLNNWLKKLEVVSFPPILETLREYPDLFPVVSECLHYMFYEDVCAAICHSGDENLWPRFKEEDGSRIRYKEAVDWTEDSTKHQDIIDQLRKLCGIYQGKKKPSQ